MIPGNLAIEVPPALEPVTVADMKTHSRIDIDADDSYIGGLIIAARRYAETVTGRQFITATWTLYLDAFPDLSPYDVRIPLPPLQKINTIKYLDLAGAQKTLDAGDYLEDIYRQPGLVTPAYGCYWPTTRDQRNAIEIEFEAGYGDAASDVPEDLRHAIKFMVAHWYEQREPVMQTTMMSKVPLTVDSLLSFYRIVEFA